MMGRVINRVAEIDQKKRPSNCGRETRGCVGTQLERCS